jgi:hypothetical protein
MANALNQTNWPMYFAIDNWRNEEVTQWAPAIAGSWGTVPPIGGASGQWSGVPKFPSNTFQQMKNNFLRN